MPYEEFPPYSDVKWGPDKVREVPEDEFQNVAKRKYRDLTEPQRLAKANARRTAISDVTDKLNVYSEEDLAKRLKLQKEGKWPKSGFTEDAERLAAKDKEWQDFLKEEEKEKFEKKLQGVRPSDIILYALSAIEIMQQLAGASLPVGLSAWDALGVYPYQGDCFKAGSQYLTQVVAALQQAVPAGWQGTAADAYNTELATLVTQTQKMAALDLQMEALVKEHAEVVVNTQLGIGIEQGVLIVAYPVIRVLEIKPETYPVAMSSACATAGGAIYAAMGLLSWCLGTSIQTGQAVDQLAYGDVIVAVQRVIDAFASAAVPAPQSSSFVASASADVSGGVSVPAATSGTPTVAASPGSASGLAPRVAPAPQQVAPATPASPAPSTARVAPPAAYAANLSNGSASPANRPNPRGQHAVAPAVRADDSQDTAARSATQGAERAPIDIAAADPERAPAPKPAHAA